MSTNASHGSGGVAEKVKGAGHVAKANREEAQRGVQQMSSGTGGGAPGSDSDSDSNPATLGSSAVTTSTYLPSGVAGAGGAQPTTAQVGALPQGRFESAHPSQDAYETSRGVSQDGGRNDREFETKYGPPGGARGRYLGRTSRSPLRMRRVRGRERESRAVDRLYFPDIERI
ncbi:uncharacterized protein B0H18DRAFT_1120184 [Fomitopsis serialis]|uniref:uncharacterized protein n=1 Tax=Fomitopsis serialis TaxID=139415 RepID=UPI002008D842|nr:uncharacterized protein B0H18DRAFT_1120184 [Neoantrodia serialis]KAH9923824.1 hypothetical protein B0H18DRAFT_1120184 [Neoantrodia serialis]